MCYCFQTFKDLFDSYQEFPPSFCRPVFVGVAKVSVFLLLTNFFSTFSASFYLYSLSSIPSLSSSVSLTYLPSRLDFFEELLPCFLERAAKVGGRYCFTKFILYFFKDCF
jgi:hypothetical protein